MILTHLISLLRAEKVFGHVLRQHVGDQRLVPPSHLKHLLLVVVHANLPQEQLPRLKLKLRQKRKREIYIYIYIYNLRSDLSVTQYAPCQSTDMYSQFKYHLVTHVTCKIIEASHHDYNHHGHEVFGWYSGSP